MFVPRIVQEFVEYVEKSVGHRPTVEQTVTGNWVVTTANERVKSVNEFKRTQGGRVCQAGKDQLFIDGVLQDRLAYGAESFAKLFHSEDPPVEFNRMPAYPEPEPITETIAPVEAGAAPRLVRRAYAKLIENEQLREATITVGKTDLFWSITIEMDGRRLRLNYWGNGDRTKPCNQHPVQLLVDGVDRTTELEGSMERAMMLFAGARPTQAVSTPPIPRAADPARHTSVEVRRATVIRV